MGFTTTFSAALRGPQRLLVLIFAGGAAGAAWFIAHNVFSYVTFNPDNFTPYYWPRRYGLLVHISAGSLALTVGLVQLWLGLTGRARALHRRLGQVYVFSVFCGSIAGLYMAATIPPPIGLYAAGLVGLEVAWIITTACGYFAIRRGALAQHRSWMIRSYVVTFGFVTFRLITNTLASLAIGNEDSQFDAAAWLCWTVPLLLTEVYLRRRKLIAAVP
jgi:uncharacterized membrane protein